MFFPDVIIVVFKFVELISHKLASMTLVPAEASEVFWEKDHPDAVFL